MRRTPLLAAAAVTLLLAGCGSSTLYTEKATKTCLVQRGAQIAHLLPNDFVAQTAVGGAFVTDLSDNFVTIAFGQSADNGQQLENAYAHFAFSNVRSGLTDVLKRYVNAVTLWHKHPQPNDLALVVGCLH